MPPQNNPDRIRILFDDHRKGVQVVSATSAAPSIQ